MKIHHRTTPLLLLFLLQLQTLISNGSSLSHSYSVSNDVDDSHLLQDVLKEIASKQKWDLQDTRILEVDVANVNFGYADSYEMSLGFGNIQVLTKFSDKVSTWKKPNHHVEASFGSVINGIGSVASLRSLKIVGPFDLTVEDDAHLSLSLPMNTSYGGLKRVLVGDGITVEVNGAEKVSVFYSSDLSGLLHRTRINKEKTRNFPFQLPFCSPLIPIRISGSATLAAYRTRNPDDYIRIISLSKDTIELLPDKCYIRNAYTAESPRVDLFKLRFKLLNRVFEKYLGNRIIQIGFMAFVKVTMKASVVVRFQLEMESKIGSNSSHHATLAGWRTKPTAQRARFEVLAGVDEGRLKPLMVKKLRPLVVTDSIEWRYLLPNISFTKFPSPFVHPEALTLDVKW